jgi:hypothetical protein
MGPVSRKEAIAALPPNAAEFSPVVPLAFVATEGVSAAAGTARPPRTAAGPSAAARLGSVSKVRGGLRPQSRLVFGITSDSQGASQGWSELSAGSQNWGILGKPVEKGSAS